MISHYALAEPLTVKRLLALKRQIKAESVAEEWREYIYQLKQTTCWVHQIKAIFPFG